MSHDRVQFQLDTACNAATRKAFTRAFGMEAPKSFPFGGTITIQCRPSQFIRFLIYRSEEGGPNSFKELYPILVPANTQRFLDVSGNPAA